MQFLSLKLKDNLKRWFFSYYMIHNNDNVFSALFHTFDNSLTQMFRTRSWY